MTILYSYWTFVQLMIQYVVPLMFAMWLRHELTKLIRERSAKRFLRKLEKFPINEYPPNGDIPNGGYVVRKHSV